LEFLSNLAVKPSRTNVKSPYWRLPGDGPGAAYSNIFYSVIDSLIKELDSRFCDDSGALLSGISNLCPRRQTFLSEEHLIEFANAYV